VRWWGGLPGARVDKKGRAVRPKKQLTSICDPVSEAERDQATGWIRAALAGGRYRFYDGDQVYPKHVWYKDEAGRYWFGFCVNGVAGAYKGWPIDEAEKLEVFG